MFFSLGGLFFFGVVGGGGGTTARDAHAVLREEGGEWGEGVTGGIVARGEEPDEGVEADEVDLFGAVARGGMGVVEGEGGDGGSLVEEIGVFCNADVDGEGCVTAFAGTALVWIF